MFGPREDVTAGNCGRASAAMDVTALCTAAAALAVLPNRSQFFKYESMTLSCEPPGNSSDWRVMMNTSTKTNQECHSSWNKTDRSSCFIDSVMEFDAGVYWCESEAGGGRSDIINISVADGDIILEAPVHPVAEDNVVTLRCKHRIHQYNLTARFYKDDVFVLSSASGNMTIRKVSKSDEGRYRCVSGDEESPDSWLTVTVQHRAWQDSHLAHVLLPVAGFSLWLVLTLLCLCRCLKGERDADLSYTDVVITEGYKPRRIKDEDDASTEYSSVKPASPNGKQQQLC